MCIAAKTALRLKEAGYMKVTNQRHDEIFFSLNYITGNLNHCVTEATPGGCCSAHISRSSSLALGYRTTVVFVRQKWLLLR